MLVATGFFVFLPLVEIKWNNISEVKQMTQSNYDKRKFTVAIVALLLALVLLLAIGGYSLAKYVTGGSSSGEAAVAKWGYTVSTDTSNLFGKNYKADVVSADTDAAQLEVKAADDKNVVAPGTINCVLMDVMMPVLDGLEATRRIRMSNRADSDVVIIAMTANTFDDDVRKVLDAGMNDNLSKPLDAQKLVKTIARYLRKE